MSNVQNGGTQLRLLVLFSPKGNTSVTPNQLELQKQELSLRARHAAAGGLFGTKKKVRHPMPNLFLWPFSRARGR
jgi:hypothetical protein